MMILSPFTLGTLQLKNRIVMEALTRSRADNDGIVPNDLMKEYYTQRASAGLIVSEGIFVSPRAVGYINVPGIFTKEQTLAWRDIVSAVHARGSVIFAQLWHVGALSHPSLLGGASALAPSAINPKDQVFTHDGFRDTETPSAMTHEDIRRTVAEFRSAAQNAADAGFDGIELLCSHGYLFAQFWARSMNQRTDEYGGSIENRMRFFFEVLEAVATVFPKSRIGLKLNPCVHGYAGMYVDEETQLLYDQLVERLNDHGLAYINIMEPMNPTAGLPLRYEGSVAGHFRKFYNGTIITNVDYSVNAGRAAVESGQADMIGFGRAFISNPDLVERIAEGVGLNPVDPMTFYTGGAKGYTDYPFRDDASSADLVDWDTPIGVSFANAWDEIQEAKASQ